MSDTEHDSETGVAQTQEIPGFSRRSFLQTSAAAGAGAVALGSGGSATAQSVSQQSCEQGTMFEVGGGDFRVFNNQWGNSSAEQCIYKYDDGSYGWDFSGGASGDGNINYPEAFVGTRAWSTDTGVPEWQGGELTRGEVDELIIEWDVDVDVPNGNWNLAEEWWLMDQPPNPDGNGLTHEIMLVLDWGSGHSHGGVREPGVWTDQFGNTIDYWAFYNEGGTSADFHIFRINGGASSGKADLTEIIDFLDERENIPDSRYFTAVELGTETFGGPTGEVRFNQFDITINGSTYTSGSGSSEPPEPEVPPEPSGLSTSNVSTNSITFNWSSVSEADEYNVYRDGGMEDTVSETSYTFSGLSAGTQYEVGVEAVNDAGTSERATTTVSTNEPPEPDVCANAADSTEVSGQTVCDVDGDGEYADINADGDVTHADVQEFFSVQHRPSWKQPGMFDFNDNGVVGHGDVVALFEDIGTGGL